MKEVRGREAARALIPVILRADYSSLLAPVAMATATQTAVLPGADAVKGYSGVVTLEAVLRVVSQGPWTPANSNGLEAALLLQLQFHRDDYPDPLQSLVQSPKIVTVLPRGPAARRLLAAQVRRLLTHLVS